MAISTCIKCGGHMFELVQHEPHGARFKMYFVQCSSCGGVVGATSYYDPGVTANLIKEEVDKLKSEVHSISQTVNNIDYQLRNKL